MLGCCRGTHLNAVVWHVWRFLTPIKADAFGVSMLHCCHKLCLRLKECLSPLSLSLCNDDDSHSNTPCRNLLPCYPQRASERERTRERKERDVFLYVALTEYLFTPSCVLPAFSVCLEKYLYSSVFPLVSQRRCMFLYL